jgi:hypothetical protein
MNVSRFFVLEENVFDIIDFMECCVCRLVLMASAASIPHGKVALITAV